MFPSFLGWRGKPHISNQIQKGKYSENIFASVQMCNITALGPTVHRPPPALQPTHQAAEAAPTTQALPEALELAHCLTPECLEPGRACQQG